MERRLAVGAVVVSRDGRVLVIRRGKPPGLGNWSIPGGKVEPGESLAEAVVREVREETGLDVKVERHLETYEMCTANYRIEEHLCTPIDDAAPLVAGDDAAEARWAEVAELASLGVSEDARAVIARALATRPRA